LPWSMCAMMEKLRMWSIGVARTLEAFYFDCPLCPGRGLG
jgi:hypothetical protein